LISTLLFLAVPFQATAWFGFFDYRHSLSHDPHASHRWRHIDAELDYVFHHLTAKELRDVKDHDRLHEDIHKKMEAAEEGHEKWHRERHGRWEKGEGRHGRWHRERCCRWRCSKAEKEERSGGGAGASGAEGSKGADSTQKK
jgi:hypothetical protein